MVTEFMLTYTTNGSSVVVTNECMGVHALIAACQNIPDGAEGINLCMYNDGEVVKL